MGLSASDEIVTYTTTGSKTKDFTGNTKGDQRFALRMPYSGGGDVVFDNFSIKQILTPSATGVTIVSTRGGTTQSWASQDAGFNYNDVHGYTYTVYREIPYTISQ